MPLIADVSVPYVQEAAITVDGLAEEPAWREAERLTGFVTFDPVEGQEPSGQTTVRLLADDQALYVFVQAADPQPHKVRAAIGRRDTRWSDDFVGFYLDTQGEGQRAYLFGANPLGIQFDGTRVAGSFNDDSSWDGIWSSSGRLTEQGYQVELAIPWRIVRHPAHCRQLGLTFFRVIARSGEKSSWPAIDPDMEGLLVQQGVVAGPGQLPASAGLDLIPELAFGWTEEGPTNHRLGAYGFFPGLTARYAPNPAVGLQATVNPDFSQVESDEAQIDVNRRYALYYEEKRPFFLEGREWFEHPFGELVYTRSMALPLYGARATVEQGEGTAAVLHVLDAQPGPSVSEGGGWSEEDLEGHQALASVMRLRHRLGRDGHVGLLASDRSVLGTSLSNRLVGADTRLRLGDRWTASGAALTSATVFADRATMWVPAANARLAYSADRLYAGSWGWYVDPDFRAENGFVTDADQQGGGSWAGATFRPGWKALPRISVTPANVWYMWNTQGELRGFNMQPHAWLQFGNGTGLWLCYEHGGELYEDAWLRTRQAKFWGGGGWTEWLEASLGGELGRAPYYDPEDPRSATITQLEGEVALRPFPRLALGGSAIWERGTDEVEALYEGWVGRARLDLYATRYLWARLIGDLSTFSDTRSTEVLLAWERAPGRAIYLGGQLDLPVGDEAWDPSWQVQAKASWVFAI